MRSSVWFSTNFRAIRSLPASKPSRTHTHDGSATTVEAKHRIRAGHRFYSQDLVNNLFSHPYTRIEFVVRDLDVSRLTATRYLDRLAKDGLPEKRRGGRASYYVNRPLVEVCARADAAV